MITNKLKYKNICQINNIILCILKFIMKIKNYVFFHFFFFLLLTCLLILSSGLGVDNLNYLSSDLIFFD